jgi:hypothetical protein
MDNNQQNNQSGTPVSKNKNIIILCVAVIVVIAIALMVRASRAPQAPAEETAAPVEETVAADDKAQAPQASSFAEVQKQYEGKMITFDKDCAATPNNLTVAKGSSIMLFNKSDASHILVAEGKSYPASAMKYRTVRLNTAGSVAITCDATASAATVTVQ